jgi:hypothetical protein
MTKNRLLLALIVVLLIFWAIGYFVFLIHGIIHMLLLIAVIVLLIRILKRPRPS